MVRHALLVAVIVLALPAPAQAIVGGDAAPPGRWPWMVALVDREGSGDPGLSQFCGGVVIAPRRVLTAAHCLVDWSGKDIDVLVGRTRLRGDGGRLVRGRSISVYPGYAEDRTPSLDAAVLTLAADAGVPPLALARPGQQATWVPGTLAWTMGWGRLNRRESPGGNFYFADRLHELQDPLQGDDACESAYGIGFDDYPYRPSQVLCAGGARDRVGVCYGDSGGPLVVGGPGAWLEVGIVTASDACGSSGYFDLYTRVDRISAFALGRALTRQPEPVTRPRIAGRLAAGRVVHCLPGRWRGSRARLAFTWHRAGRARPIGHRRSLRLTRRDVSGRVTCTITASNRGGHVASTSRPR